MSVQDESARDGSYADLTGSQSDAYRSRENYWGTAGWPGESQVEDIGTAQNGGRTLARVTLFDGKQGGVPVLNGQAQGRQVLVQVLGPFFAIPPANTQVLCCFPGGDISTPGNGAIIGWGQSSPQQQFSATRAVIDMGPNMDLVEKARTVTIMQNSSATGAFVPWIGIGPIAGSPSGVYINDGYGAGIQATGGVVGLVSTDGSAAVNPTCLLQLGKDDLTMSYAGGGYITLTATKTEVFHSTNANVVAATVALGVFPIFPVIIGLSAISGIPSTCVLGS